MSSAQFRTVVGWLGVGALAMFLLTQQPQRGYAGLYSSAVLSDTPVGYYRMNETTGSVAIDTVGVAHGVYRNGAIPAAQPPNGVGPVLQQPGPRSPAFPGFDADNDAVQFDGAASFSNPDNLNISTLSLNDTAYSFEIWAYNTRPQADLLITGYMGARGTGTSIDGVGIMGTLASASTATDAPPGTLFLTDGVTILSGDSIVENNQWHHVVYTRSGDSVALYLNGELELSDTLAPTYGTSDAITAGMRPDQHWAFQGMLDELALYNYALSPEQVLAHYDAASAAPVPEPSSVALVAVGTALLWGVRKKRVCSK